MNLPSNLFNNYVPPQTFLCQPDKTIIGELQPYDFSAVFKFNTYSDTSFTISKTYIDIRKPNNTFIILAAILNIDVAR